MAIVVRLVMSWSRASWIFFSVSTSTEEVASSRMRIGGFCKMARAMERRCFSPPDRRKPRSPMTVS